MKRLGRGWQYTTYDLENGKVLKKLNTRFTAYCVLMRDCFPYVTHPFWKFAKYYTRCKNEAAYSLKMIQQSTLESWMIGNARVLKDLSYEQDKLMPIRTYLKKNNAQEGQKIIDQFIEFNKTLMANSVIDRNFLITDNFAINKNGQIVLMDLGELYFDSDIIKEHIMSQPWKTDDVVNSLPEHLRSYFIEKMNQAFIL